jgi:hypothetical protein
MTKSLVFAGGCLCGAIRFEALGPALKPHSCSCKMCQRHSGALTTCWAEFPAASVAWIGTGGTPSLYRASQDSSRAFCPKCGSSIGAVDDAPIIALLLGVFDAPNRRELMPLSESYKSARPKWWHPQAHIDAG